jgi:hypothetical protein
MFENDCAARHARAGSLLCIVQTSEEVVCFSDRLEARDERVGYGLPRGLKSSGVNTCIAEDRCQVQ